MCSLLEEGEGTSEPVHGCNYKVGELSVDRGSMYRDVASALEYKCCYTIN